MEQPKISNKKQSGNNDAVSDAYKLFSNNGYSKSQDDFVQLISSNPEALNDAHKLFKDNGYSKDVNEFSNLLGLKKKEQSNSIAPKTNTESVSKPISSVSAKSKDTIGQTAFSNPIVKPTNTNLGTKTSQVANDAYDYANKNFDAEKSAQRLNDEIDNNQWTDKVQQGLKGFYNKNIGLPLTALNREMGGDKNFTMAEYKPLERETKVAKEELEKEAPKGTKITQELVQERAKELFLEKDKQEQMHQLIDKALPSGYDREGIWKELRLEQIRSNDILRSRVASAEVYKKKIEDFQDFTATLSPEEVEKGLSADKIEKFNSMLTEAKQATSSLEYLGKTFDDSLSKATNDAEKLELFKYNYNDFEKIPQLLSSTTKGILGGSMKLAGEAYNYVGKKTDNPIAEVGGQLFSEVGSDLLSDSERETAPYYRYKASSINNFSDLGSFAAQLGAEQGPILASIYFGGNLGTGLVSASSGGQQIDALEKEYGNRYSQGQRLLAGILYTGAEFFPEKFGTARILKDLEKTIASASTASRKLFNVSKFEATTKAISRTAFNTTLEGGTEYITAESQITIDEQLLGIVKTSAEKNELRFESAVSGGGMGIGMSVIGGAIGFGVAQSRLYSDKKDIKAVQSLFKNINSRISEIETNKDLNDAERGELYKQVNDLNNQAFAIVEKNAAKGIDLSVAEKSFLLDVNQSQTELKEKAKEITDSNFTPEMKKSLLGKLETEFNALENKRNETLEGNYNVITELSETEVTELKNKASRELLAEQPVEEGKEITLTDKQITDRAIKIYERGRNKSNVQPIETETTNNDGAPKSADEIGSDVLVENIIGPEAQEIAPTEVVEEVVNENPKTVRESISDNGIYIYDGEKGVLSIDGQQVVFETSDKIIELGNVEELSETDIKDLGIEQETELNIVINDDNSFVVNEKNYYNRYSNPESAINKDKDGNYSITLENEKGEKRTFRGQQAEQMVYQYKLKNLQENATEQQVELAEQLTNEAIEIENTIRETSPSRKNKSVRKGKQRSIKKIKEPKTKQNVETTGEEGGNTIVDGNIPIDPAIVEQDGISEQEDTATENVQPTVDSRASEADVKTLNEDQKKQNSIVSLKNYFNKLSVSKRRGAEGQEVRQRLIQMASDLGFTISEQKNKISIKGTNGKEAGIISFKEVIPQPSQSEIDSAKKEIENGLLSGRIDLGIDSRDIAKGKSDLAKGNYNTIPAKRLVNAINEAKETGTYVYMEGSGGTLVRMSVPRAEMIDFDMGVTNAEVEQITQAENELAQQHDEWFNSLTEEEQNIILNNYENTNDTREISNDAESAKSAQNVPNKEAVKTEPKPKPRATAKERIKIADAKIDDIANSLKGIEDIFGFKIKIDDVEGLNKNGIDIIDTIASIAKQAVAAGIEIDEAIQKTIDHLKKTLDFDASIEDIKARMEPKVEETIYQETQDFEKKKGQKAQAFSTRSFNSENLSQGAKDKLQKLGLNYDVESQSLAQKNAETIIDKLGIVDAYNLAKTGQIRGGARMWIMAQMFEDINNQIIKATKENNNELATYLESELSKIMKEFANERTLSGQENAMLYRIYNTFNMKYDVNFARENWVKRFDKEIPADIEAKFAKLENEVKELEKQRKELQDIIGTLEEQQAIENLKEAVNKSKTKKPSASSLKKAAVAFRKAKFTQSISDLSTLQSDPLGVIKGIFDGAIETIAVALEAGSTIEQAVKKGIIEIKKSDWYKNLSPKSKIEAEKIAKRDFSKFIDEQIAIPEVNSEIEEGPVKIPSDLLYTLVSQGVDNITDLTDKVREVMLEEYPNITHREVRDLITGYGKQVQETQDDIKIEISRIKTDGKQMSALEDLGEGNRPKRSGRKAKEYTPEQRNRIKKIRELLKNLPIDDSIDTEKYYKSALEALKTRAENRIKDLQDAINKNQRIVNERRNTVLDTAAELLISKRDALQKEYDETFGKPYKSDQTLIDEIIKRKEKSLRDLEVKLESVKLEGKELPRKEKRTVTDPKIDVLNEQIESVREELNDALEQTGIAESKRLERGKSASKRRLNELNEKLRTGDYTRRKPKKYKYDKELMEIKKQIILAKTKWDIEFEKEEFRNLNYSEKTLEYFYRVFGTFKGLKATADLSAMLRQGVVLGSRNPKEYLKASVEMHKFAFSSEYYQNWMTELETADDFIYIMEDGVSITDTSGDVLRGEERFVGNLLKNAPVVGQITEGSERAYGGFLNSLRVDVYRKIVRDYELMGITREEHPKKYKNIAKFVNNATGRGVMTPDKRIAKALNILLFSPRMISGMAGIFKDMVRSDSTPYLRRQAFTSIVTFIGYQFAMKYLIGSMLGLIGGDDGEEVVMDMNPVSTDFNKVKKGDRRYDVSSGYGIAARTIARVVLAKKKTGNSDKEQDLRNAYGKTPFSEIPDFAINKLNPLSGQIYKFHSGDHPTKFMAKREDATAMDYVLALTVPISIMDFIENVMDGTPEGLIVLDLILNTYGIGVQSYGPAKKSNSEAPQINQRR